MPPDAAYRKHTEAIIKERAQIIENCQQNVERAEQQINCGQIEEVIVQAENELTLARKMLNWKPWEPLMKEAPPNQWTWPPAQPK